MAEWQPIETAPKDGSTILVTGLNYGRANGARHLALVFWNEDAGEWRDRAESIDAYAYLTHWCAIEIPPLTALPDPPERTDT